MEFNQVEKESKAKQEVVKMAMTSKVVEVDMFDIGWNSALELAAVRVEGDFVKAFGKDTLSSIAIFIRGLKK